MHRVHSPKALMSLNLLCCKVGKNKIQVLHINTFGSFDLDTVAVTFCPRINRHDTAHRRLLLQEEATTQQIQLCLGAVRVMGPVSSIGITVSTL